MMKLICRDINATCGKRNVILINFSTLYNQFQYSRVEFCLHNYFRVLCWICWMNMKIRVIEGSELSVLIKKTVQKRDSVGAVYMLSIYDFCCVCCYSDFSTFTAYMHTNQLKFCIAHSFIINFIRQLLQLSTFRTFLADIRGMRRVICMLYTNNQTNFTQMTS